MQKFHTNTKNLEGKRFGRLIVTAFGFYRSSPSGGNRAFWKCKCDCGKEATASTTQLLTNKMKSCGCYRNELSLNRILLQGENNKLLFGESGFNRLVRTYKRQAKERNLVFDIPIDKFKEITSSNCYYCGAPPVRESGDDRDFGVYKYNGLDRIDNSLAYTLDNVVACCYDCNYSKRKRSQKDFFEWIKKIVAKHSLL